MAVAIAVPMALTFIFNRTGAFSKKDDKEAVSPAQALAEVEEKETPAVGTVVTIQSPLTGEAKPLSEAVDPVFAQGVMGQGVLIQPTEGLLTAPVSGVISVLFPSKHAVGILSDEGVELLMHIGMDTVNLDGKGFEAHVTQGDRVAVGDKLITFDMDVIKEAGYVTETPVIVTNQYDYQPDAIGDLPREVKRGEDVIKASKI